MTQRSGRRASTSLRVSVTDARGRRLPGASGAALVAWLPSAAPRAARGEVSIALVSDRVMRRLNRAHRGVDRATDVLSFPADAPRTGRTRRDCLGDIAIARGVAARQARQAGHPIGTELRILALHGLLHLLGYDHEADRGRMERVEERLRRRAGLPAGLILRASARARRGVSQ
jgi:probable rRNA maturation factor